MKKSVYILALIAILSLACNLPMLVTPVPAPTSTSLPSTDETTSPPPPPTEAPGDLTAAPTPVAAGTSVVIGNISFVIPEELGIGATHEAIARAEGDTVAPWEVAPEHIKILIENYPLQGTFHDPQIYVYPTQDYLAMSNGAAISIKRLQGILANPAAPLTNETLPTVPFFNAAQTFAAQIQVIKFQNGTGVRMLTQYGQAVGPVNNHSLFYHFEGLTNDGSYYIIAILPVTTPVLTADDNPDSPVPAGGIPFPSYSDPNADFVGYFNAITDKLNATAPEAFQPTLSALDQLIASIGVAIP